jgi:hypothetical protein
MHTLDIMECLTSMFTAAVGNEANVEIYANYTGFMWEAAREFEALVIFAEVHCRAFLLHSSAEWLLAHIDSQVSRVGMRVMFNSRSGCLSCLIPDGFPCCAASVLWQE